MKFPTDPAEILAVEQAPRKERQRYYSASFEATVRAGGPICNVCGGTEFVDQKERVGSRCASCKSYERTRVMALHLAGIPIEANTRILHIAPERGITRMLMDRSGRYRAADIDIDRYGYLDLDQIAQVDLCKDLSNIAGEYDLIIHSHVLEHVKCNFTAVLARLNAHLSPGGRQLFQIPIMPGEYAEDFRPVPPGEEGRPHKDRFGQDGHVRRFGRSDLADVLGMLFDFGPYAAYDLKDRFGEQVLLRHNIPNLFWYGPTQATVFDVSRDQFALKI